MRFIQTDNREDIAITGMACLFPGASGLDEYWRLILEKECVIGDPPDEWMSESYYQGGARTNDKTYCQKGGYLGHRARFDPLEFGVIPNTLDGGEPDQFLSLKVAREALRDAGYNEKSISPERTEVIVGRGTYINRGLQLRFNIPLLLTRHLIS